MAQRRRRTGTWVLKDDRLFTLAVFIINGPMAKKFIEKNKVVSRTIQMRGDQTLEDLHYAVFDAFKRFDQHMYEFQINGKRPMNPKARRYVLAGAMDETFTDSKPAGDVALTTIGSLGLKVDDAFGYWFDFGDDWWHQINVVAITEKAGRGKYPRVTKRMGKSPPQYVDWDEEE